MPQGILLELCDQVPGSVNGLLEPRIEFSTRGQQELVELVRSQFWIVNAPKAIHGDFTQELIKQRTKLAFSVMNISKSRKLVLKARYFIELLIILLRHVLNAGSRVLASVSVSRSTDVHV